MSGVKYSPLYNKSCKTGTSLQDDVNIIAGSANSVLVNFFNKCNIGETISEFTAKGLDVYLDIDAFILNDIKDGQEMFKDLADKDVFRNIKGISVSNGNSRAGNIDLKYYSKKFKDIFANKNISVGIKLAINISNGDSLTGFKNAANKFIEYNNDFDYILLNAYIPESSIDSTKFALKVFDENFIRIKELEKPIYLQIESKKKKLEDESFLKVLRELECRQSDKINYFMADSFGPDSIFKKDSAYNKFESLGKDSYDCQYHGYIGNWENKPNDQ
ncbi:hypothetical protein BB561_001324 [Smittium simulii]|uniref:Uncharacterized protein n=1 Tax=Smittium simulii TaxID=133385 RepID=A0A2T9YV99_9FUNG|nr:hypothetical protein BB561_001324 [Smittium simulii]